MSNQGLGYALLGLAGGTTGYLQQKDRMAKQKQEEEELALKKSLGEGSLGLAKKKADEDVFKQIAEENMSGFKRDEANKTLVANPDFFNPESDLYKLQKQRAAFKAMESPAASKPAMTWGQIFNLQGKPLPQGVDPNAPAPDTVAQEFFKKSDPGSTEDLSFLASNPSIQEMGLTPSQLRAVRAGGTVSSLIKEGTKPKVVATPEQIAAYEAEFGPGTAAGLKPSEIAMARSRQEQLNQNRRNQDRLAGQFAASEGRQAGQFDVSKGLQIATATQDETRNIKAIDSQIKRLDEIEKEAASFKPSGAEYQVLKRKAQLSSLDPGRLGLFGGKPILVQGLTPEQQKRLEWYQSLATDSVANMFETGGKTLTDNEKRELPNLAVTPGDTSEQILAKIPRLKSRLTSKRDQSQAIVDSFNIAGGSVKSSPLKNRQQAAPQAAVAPAPLDKKRIPGETIEQWRARTKGK